VAEISTTFEAPSFVRRHRKRRLRALGIGIPVLVLLAAGVYVADQYWPYRYRNVKPLLEQVLASKVTVAAYHRTYFPHPGFVATALTLRRNSAPDLPPVGSTEDLIVQGSWLDLLLFRRRVRLVDIKGLHVVIPPVGSRANKEDFPPGSSGDFAGPETAVETLVIHGAVLDIMRTNGGRYTYPIRKLIMRNLQQGHAVSYSVDTQNAYPAGRIQASGSFGPLTPQNLGGTPVSGKFTFTGVQLDEIGELHGTLSSEGHFSGALAAIEIYATASTGDLAVGTGQPVPVNGTVQLTTNALTGNVALHRVEVKTGETTVEAEGTVAGSVNTPKTTDLDLSVSRGRAQDLLRPFLKDRPPIMGAVALKAHAHLASSDNGEEFLQRLSVDGGFVLPGERLTNHDTARTLTDFSQRAQGLKQSKTDSENGKAGEAEVDPAADVVSSIEGQVKIRNGVVSTERLTFEMPGASADLNGSYDLRKGTVHLVGDLKMESDISHVTTGFKSLLLKPLAPFFKKKHAGAVIPIAVTGGPDNYTVSQDLLHDK
jgi:AsmA-like C-terminal region